MQTHHDFCLIQYSENNGSADRIAANDIELRNRTVCGSGGTAYSSF